MIYASGSSRRYSEGRYEVAQITVRTYLQKAQNGTPDQRITPPGRPRIVQAEHERHLLSQLDTHPDTTLEEHARMLHTATGLKISGRTVNRVFRRHRIIHKKRTRAFVINILMDGRV